MALNVPDESLATIAEADAYHEGRGNIAQWESLEGTRKEQLLRQGFDYLYAVYGGQWPAGAAFGIVGESVPAQMRDACAILALKAKAGPLMPEQTAQKVEVTVGPITTKYAEQAGGVIGIRRFPDIDRLVAPFLAPAPSPYMATLIRN